MGNLRTPNFPASPISTKTKDYHVEVGKPDPRNNELVIAILKSNTYLVCTPNRGVVRGIPILVGQDKVERTTDFQVN